jgi:hypothetical protein
MLIIYLDKNIMSLNNLKNIKKILLSDAVNDNWSENIISNEQFEKLINTDYSNSYQNIIKYNKCIYRGDKNLREDKIYQISPSLRKSRDGISDNIYTTLFSEILPSWSKYPKRNHCIIGITENNRIGQYGKRFIILPKNGTELGICLNNDMWDSFNIQKLDENIGNNNIRNFCNSLLNIFSYITKKKYNYIDKDVILYWFNEVAPEFFKYPSNIKKIKKYPMFDTYSYAKIISIIIENCNNLIEYYDKSLNAKDNGFELIDISEYKNIEGIKEVWFDNTCLILSLELAKNIFKESII